MTTQTEKPAIRKSIETVETVKSLRTGWDISFTGRGNGAYLANSVEKIDDIGVGDQFDISYHMDESSRGRFARIVEVHAHTPADGYEEPSGEASQESANESGDESGAKEFSATVKSLKATPAGLRLDLGYANGAFASYQVVKAAGLRVQEGDEVSGTFEMDENDEGKFARVKSITSVVSGSPAAVADSAESDESGSEDAVAEEPASEEQASGSDDPRAFDRKVAGLKKMRTGLELDLGYDAPAFVSYRTLKAAGVQVNEGDQVSGSYQMEDGRSGKFARITEVSGVNAG